MSTQPEYWNEQYISNETPWDIGTPSIPLQSYFRQLPPSAGSKAILIPGCGNAYEASWLLDNGFTDITLLDISPILTQRLREKFPADVKIITADFFTHDAQYDLIVEQTFFCALPPELRKNYMEKMYTLLRPGGRLIGLLFDRQFPPGPPFGGSLEEYQTLFAQTLFHLITLSPCYNSIKPRQGTELFFIAEKPHSDRSLP